MRNPTVSRAFIALIGASLLACQVAFNLGNGRQLVLSPEGAQLDGAGAPGVGDSGVEGIPAILTAIPEAIEGEERGLVPSATPQRDTELNYSTLDREDEVDGYQVHFIYMLPEDGEDAFLDVSGEIALSAQAMNEWLAGQTEGSRLRYDTYQGDLDVSFLLLDHSSEEISALGTEILGLIEYELKTRGFNAGNKLCVVYYDGFFVSHSGYCGISSHPPDGLGVTAALLLRGYSPEQDAVCPRQFTKSIDYVGYFETTILHELLHLLGMVPECAPHGDGGHVSDSPQDLMYFQYDGSYSPLYTYLDYRNDDYFDHGDPNCADLARSAFLEPLPHDAELPPRWEDSNRYLPENPIQ